MAQHDTCIHIVAGFLGAGKTTFINKLFADGIDASSTVLIENELGDTPVDDELLQTGDLEVRTLASGCVCCSLRADLADTIELIVEKYAPKTILIEPTGVASPNELIRICANDLWHLPLKVESVVTIVYAQAVEAMLDLDIGVFDEQLKQARLIVLSRTQFMEPDEVAHVRELLWEHIGKRVPIVDAPWDEVDALEVLGIAQEAFAAAEHGHAHAHAHEDDGHSHERGEHEHGHDHSHAHGHAHDHEHAHGGHIHHAGDIASYVIHPEGTYDDAALQTFAQRLDSGNAGQILRAKGFVRSTDGSMLHVEYVYGSMQVSPINYTGEPKLVVIGRNLDYSASLFA